eukprot:g4895.t1
MPVSRKSSRKDSERPPSVTQLGEKLSRGQGIVYLDMLLALTDPELGIANDTGKLIQFIFNSWIWMDALWHFLVQDIRRGSCSTIVPRSVLQEDAWEALARELKADPATADTLEAALRTMCFHQRAGKLQETLERLGVAKVSREVRNGNHLAKHQKEMEEGRLRALQGKRRRRQGTLVLSWEAEAAAALKVPNDIPRTFKPYKPVSAREQRDIDNMDILRSDLLAASYEFQTTGFDRGFRRWVDPKFDTGFPLDKSVAGFGFVCGFPGREPLGRPLFCKRPGCRARFLRFNDLFDHNREHEKEDSRLEVEKLQRPLELQYRNIVRIPPKSVSATFRKCGQHRYLIPDDCDDCKAVSDFNQPRRPACWFRTVRFKLQSNMPMVIDIADDQQRLPVVSTRVGSTVGLFPVVTLAIAEDAVGKAWIAGRLLVRAQTLIAADRISERDLPKDFDEVSEVIEDASSIHFFPISEIVTERPEERVVIFTHGKVLRLQRFGGINFLHGEVRRFHFDGYKMAHDPSFNVDAFEASAPNGVKYEDTKQPTIGSGENAGLVCGLDEEF